MIDLISLAKRVAELGELKPDKADLAALRKLQAAYQSAWEARNIIHPPGTAGARYQRQLAEQAEILKRGEKLPRSYAFDDFVRDNQAKGDVARLAMQEISEAAQAPAGRIHQKFLAIMESTVAAETEAEQRDFARFDLPFVPSPKLAALRQLLDWTRLIDPTLPNRAGASPANLVPFLSL